MTGPDIARTIIKLRGYRIFACTSAVSCGSRFGNSTAIPLGFKSSLVMLTGLLELSMRPGLASRALLGSSRG